jgi:hypothetical protein
MSIAEEPTQTAEVPSTIPLEPAALTTAEQVAKHNAETTSPDAPADVHSTEVEGPHETIFAGNADSLGSLNAVLNRLEKDKRKVLQIRRVWAVRVSVEKPKEVDPSQVDVERIAAALKADGE